MRRKLLHNCSEASRLSSKRRKSDSQESPTVQLTETAPVELVGTEVDKAKRMSRKMVALFLSYNGYGYHGMQFNAGIKTIEGELLQAVCKAGAIDEENMYQLGNLKFQRASKTDKGVSAVRQIVSLKMDILKDYLEAINSFLPSGIRVLRALRVTQSFNAKHFCSSRHYSYLCPTFAFAPSYELTYEGYRIDKSTMDKLQAVLDTFRGTHNFHNYTSAVLATSPSCNRYIMQVSLGLPFVSQETGLELISIQLHGQSFMLHQIRKMIGITIAVMKHFAEEDIIPRSFNLATIETPKAPSLGLLLERQEFRGYNNKFGQDGLHLPIQWDSLEGSVTAFRDEFIYPHIIQQEAEHKSMFLWLGNLGKHNFTNDPGKELPKQAPDESKALSDASETQTIAVDSTAHSNNETIPGSIAEATPLTHSID